MKHPSFIYTVKFKKAILFQTIPLSTNKQFSAMWPIDKILSGATNLDQSGPESVGNEGVLRIPALLKPHHQIV